MFAPHLFALTFDIFKLVAEALQDAVKGLMLGTMSLIVHSPEPDLTSLWYRGEYHLMMQIAGYVVVLVALLATISAILRGGMKELLRTFAIGLPVAVLGGVVAIGFVTLLQKVDQDMTEAMMSHTWKYFDAFYASINAGSAWGQFGQYELDCLEIILFLNLLVFAILLWIELIFREVMIYMSVMFIPMALAAFVWAPLRNWIVGIAEVVATMVFSKFIIAAIMSFGFLATTTSLRDIAVFMGGLITMAVACVAAPILIVFVMQPHHDMITRGQVAPLSPIGADRSYARGAFINQLKGRMNKSPASGKPVRG